MMGGVEAYRPFAAPAPMFAIGWGEDIDLSGGAAAIAAVKGQVPDFIDGTDDLIPDYDIFIKRILYADETDAAQSTARLAVDRAFGNTKTIWRNQVEAGADRGVVVWEYPGRGLLIPQGTKLSMTGALAGSGAEQHVCILHCYSPHFRPPMRSANPASSKFVIGHGLKTGTLVAATLSGKNDILGHTADYEDSELAFGIDPAANYVLYGIIPRPGLAATGIVGFQHPTGQFFMLWPSVFIKDSGIVYPMDQPWAFNGAEKAAPKLVGAGAVTTSTEFQPLFGML